MENYKYESDDSLFKLLNFGQLGLRILTGNAIIGEKFVVIQSITNCVISCKLDPINNSDSTITSLQLTAGMVIYGRFYDLEVTSGKIIAYKG